MKFLFKILFIFLIINKISSSYLIKRDTSTAAVAPISKPFCFHSVCGWELEKDNGIIEYVENNCKCKPDEQCLRTAKEYRLLGYKYHCRKIAESKDQEIVTFPPPNKINSQQQMSDD